MTNITFHENREEFRQGENVLCKADGHPTPRYEWKNKTENVVSAESSYTIDENSLPGDMFSCTATNEVKGVSHSISKSLTVMTGLIY